MIKATVQISASSVTREIYSPDGLRLLGKVSPQALIGQTYQRVSQITRNLGKRLQNKGVLGDFIARNLQAPLLDYPIVIQQ
jgi:hypothetical protein